MEQETCSHEEKEKGGEPEIMTQNRSTTPSGHSQVNGNKSSEPDCGQQNAYAYQGAKYEQPNQMNMGQPNQMNMGQPNQMNMGYQSMQQQPPPYQGFQQAYQQPHFVGMPQQSNHGGTQQQPHSAGMQQPSSHSAGMQPQSNHSGMQPPPHQSSGHKKQGQSHCSCGNHQQYGQQYGTPPAGHVTEMMGRFMSGNVTPEDVNAVGGYFGIDCQSTRFWTGIILGAAGALLLSRSFKSE
ncbi:MAG: hypothetical protein HQK72_09680 [Desulfamplus sp.]|nr:hypothetical protein [Desulfamplus sp.]